MDWETLSGSLSGDSFRQSLCFGWSIKTQVRHLQVHPFLTAATFFFRSLLSWFFWMQSNFLIHQDVNGSENIRIFISRPRRYCLFVTGRWEQKYWLMIIQDMPLSALKLGLRFFFSVMRIHILGARWRIYANILLSPRYTTGKK